MPHTSMSDTSSARSYGVPFLHRSGTAAASESRPAKPNRLNYIFGLNKDHPHPPEPPNDSDDDEDQEKEESDSGTIRSQKHYVLRVTNADIQPSSSEDEDEDPAQHGCQKSFATNNASKEANGNNDPTDSTINEQVLPFETNFLSIMPSPTESSLSLKSSKRDSGSPTMTPAAERLVRRQSKTLQEFDKKTSSEWKFTDKPTEFLPPVHVPNVDWSAVSEAGERAPNGAACNGNNRSTVLEDSIPIVTSPAPLSPLARTDQESSFFGAFPRNISTPIATRESGTKLPSVRSGQSVLSSSNESSRTTALLRASQSKYAKASLSILHNPDGLKLYRESALKTNDPVIQLEYAKYLLEIAALFDRTGTDSTTQQRKNSAASSSIRRSARDSIDGRIADIVKRGRTSLNYPKRLYRVNEDTATLEGNDQKREMLVEEAVDWIKRLANQDVGEAAYMLATWMEHGKYGFRSHPHRQHRLYEVAARANIPGGIYAVAKQKEHDGEQAEAYALYTKASELGLLEAVHRVALVYLHGELGQRQNMTTGLALLSQAAEHAEESYPEPLYTFAQVLANVYPPADIPVELVAPYGGVHAAFSYFERAASMGHSGAQSQLGFIYEHGLYGSPVDYEKSFQFYSQAAEGQDTAAMLGLSRLYNGGCHGPDDVDDGLRFSRDISGWLQRTEQDEDKAFEWCQKAAEGGLDKAVFLLGWYYDIGLGTPRDSVRSQLYYKQAAEMGLREAQEKLDATRRASQQGNYTRSALQATPSSDSHKGTNCILM